ncbi:hypothetical protein ACQ3I4_08995 [Zafaria sp. Z1313]|uniref:hypothetical protein n=1 Tax=unclassified Zafaria TaxID=2828765 RepID=UPI002E7954F3|nr:hypothetical protein [Zafaria sp. J156]MEE1621661.1 hypothetical protein [Zafaria sp. J156]
MTEHEVLREERPGRAVPGGTREYDGGAGPITPVAYGFIASVRYVNSLRLLRYCLRNSLPFPGRHRGLLLALATLGAVVVVPALALLAGAAVSLVAGAIGIDPVDAAGVILLAVVVSAAASAVTALTGRAREELVRPVDGPHYVGLDLHPWASGTAHVLLPRLLGTLARSGVGALACVGAVVGAPGASPEDAAACAVAAALVPWAASMTATGLQITLAARTRGAAPGWAATATGTVLLFGAVLAATALAAAEGRLSLPGDEVLLGSLRDAGAFGARMAPAAAYAAGAVCLLGAGLLSAVLAALRGSRRPGPYAVPGALREPRPTAWHRTAGNRPGREGTGPAGAGRAFPPTPGSVHRRSRGLATMLVRQVRGGASQASALYRRLERVMPLLGAVVAGFGAGILATGEQQQVAWLDVASAGALAMAVVLVGLTVTSASGPVSWIPRLRWLADSGIDTGALCRSVVVQALRLCAVPVLVPVAGFCLVRSSPAPLIEAAALVTFLTAVVLVADLVDPQRQENGDGSAEGGLGGTLVLLLGTLGATTVWLLPWGAAVAGLSAAAGLMLWWTPRLLRRRIHPWRLGSDAAGHRSSGDAARRPAPTPSTPTEDTP